MNKLVNQIETARENLQNGKIESIISPPKYRGSVFNGFYSGQSSPTSPTKLTKLEMVEVVKDKETPENQPMIRARSGKKPLGPSLTQTAKTCFWPGEGRTGWHKVSSEYKHSQLARFGAYSRIDDVSDFDERGTKIRFRLDALKNLYYADDLMIQNVLREEESIKNPPNSLNKTFSEMNNNLIARVDFANQYFSKQSGRVVSLLAKKYLGKTVRVIESQEIFGERALESKSARTATVYSQTACKYSHFDSRCLTLGRDEYNQYIRQAACERRESKHNLLRRVFAGLETINYEIQVEFVYFFSVDSTLQSKSVKAGILQSWTSLEMKIRPGCLSRVDALCTRKEAWLPERTSKNGLRPPRGN